MLSKIVKVFLSHLEIQIIENVLHKTIRKLEWRTSVNLSGLDMYTQMFDISGPHRKLNFCTYTAKDTLITPKV